MKKILLNIFILSILLSIEGYCQKKEIISNTRDFNFLIGMEYSEVHELGDFKVKGQAWQTDSTGSKFGTSKLAFNDYMIIVSEQSINDEYSITDSRKILDLIVLNELCSSCTGCLKSNKQNTDILTIHPVDSVLSRETIIVAFMIDLKTGKFKQINPDKFEWKHNAL